jgi:biopolymer transport protein ExbD
MNLRRHRRGQAQLESGALSDILFILMLFFLMISTMISVDAIKVDLPRTQTTKTTSPRQVLTLAVTKDLKYFLNGKPVTLEELPATLEKQAKAFEKPSVFLKIDKTLQVQDFVNILVIVKQLQIPIAGLATSQE